MTDWLLPLRDALDAVDGPVPFFFRDDDAGWGDTELGLLLDLFEEHEMPIDVAVIPDALGPHLARGLHRRLDRSRLRIHQHGYRHQNHERTGRKCEFGPSRSAADQHGDIAAGRERLLATFGTALDPVFTPPWNRCTDDTIAAMRAEGLMVLSRDVTATALSLGEVVEVPVTVDWLGQRKGVRLTRHDLSDRMAREVTGRGPVGVMLHHAQTDRAGRAAIGELLALLSAHPAAQPTSIAALGAGSRS